MNIEQVCEWVLENRRRRQIISTFHQPLTALQLARREGIDLDRAGYLLWELTTHALVECLNRSARKSRLYWLTKLGLQCQARVRRRLQLHPLRNDSTNTDWNTYGWILYRHRAAIVKTLTEPANPATIKRRARRQDQTLRMSANNVRDVIKLFLRRGVVRPVVIRGEHHPRYELTDAGRAFRRLLVGAESAGSLSDPFVSPGRFESQLLRAEAPLLDRA